MIAALAALDPDQRAAVVLRHLLEYTPGEIAKLLEVPRGTVNSRLRRALDRLALELDQGEGPLVRRTSFESRVREALHAARPPRAADAERRAWRVVAAAHAERPAARSRRRGPRIAAALAVAGLLLGLLLTPAGARVGDWIGEVVSPAPEATRSALASLPAEGRLLVVAESGPWVVGDDGARRRLGAYRDAAWSPGGLYVVAAKGRRLIALEPDGDERWTRVAPARVATPRWSPDGFRIAYRSGGDLHVAIGDNSDSWLLERGVRAAPPAWRPGQPVNRQVLAYARGRRLFIARADPAGGSRLLLGRTPPGPVPRQLWWSAGGRRLIAVSARSVGVYGPRGRPVRSIPLARGLVASESALAPDGRRLALIASVPGADSSELLLMPTDRRAAAEAPRGLWPAGGADLVDRRAGTPSRPAAGRPVAVPATARTGRARGREGHPLQVQRRAPCAQRRLSPPGGLVLRGPAESGRVEPLALLLRFAQPQLWPGA